MRSQAEAWQAAGGAAVPVAGRPIPWEDPDLGRMRGLVRTLGSLLWHPGEFFPGLGRGGRAEPLAFGLITGTVGFLFSLFWSLLLWGAASWATAEAPGILQVFVAGSGAMLALMAASPLLVLAGLGIGSLCLWGGVAAVGASPGFVPVWRVYCYTEGGMVLGVIPFFGAPVAGVWVLYLLYQGIKTVFDLSPERTLAALAIFLVLQVMVWAVFLGSLLAGLALLGVILFLG